MKYILVMLFLALSVSTYADRYSDAYKERVARERAYAHPQGSGIGTNKWNVDYNADYPVNKYIRSTYDSNEGYKKYLRK